MPSAVPAGLRPVNEWWDSPLVSNAVKRLKSEDRLTATDLLLAVHDTITGLEERFPGIPFRDVLSAAPARRPVVRRAMLAAGVNQLDVELVMGGVRSSAPQAGVQTPQYYSPHFFEAIRRGDTIAQIAALGASPTYAEHIRAWGAPMQPSHKRFLEILDEGDLSITQAAERAGITRVTAQKALGKQAYRDWLWASYGETVA